MKVYRGLARIPAYANPVVAVGVFDGVHRGHRHILKSMVSKARRTRGTSMVLTFYPHPQKEESIYSLAHRLRLFEELGVKVCVVVRFDKFFARIAPEDFIRRLLAKRIQARYLFIGENFRFGKDARGDVSLLKRFSKVCDFKVKAFGVVKSGTIPVSSTLIRKLILSGNIRQAQRLLLRPVSVLGKVVRGTGLATRLGFPTANVSPLHEIVPPAGIYCVWVVVAGKRRGGICYIGTRPTFHRHHARAGKVRTVIEAHIFDFHKNLYGTVIEVQFLFLIRTERLFSGESALRAQIQKDILRAKKFFSSH